MIKVMFFLKKADHLSHEEFYDWWLNKHAPAIVADQAPYLRRYHINLAVKDASHLAPSVSSADLDWDGVGIQYFDTVEDYNAVYTRTNRPTTPDTLKHIKEAKRFVVEEYEFDVSTGERR